MGVQEIMNNHVIHLFPTPTPFFLEKVFELQIYFLKFSQKVTQLQLYNLITSSVGDCSQLSL